MGKVKCSECGEIFSDNKASCPNCYSKEFEPYIDLGTPPPLRKEPLRCSNCGNVVEANARFCRSCGASLSTVPIAAAVSYSKPAASSDSSALPIIIAIIIILVILLVAISGLTSNTLNGIIVSSILFYILLYLIPCTICGFVGRHIVRQKGYDDAENHGFAWGFFLAVIGLIVCATKPDKNAIMYAAPQYAQPTYAAPSQPARATAVAASNIWRCKCGMVNKDYETSCRSCGGPKKITISRQKAPIAEWRCSCGAMNRADESACHRCGKTYNELQNEEKAEKEAKNDLVITTPSRQPETPSASASISDQLTEYKQLLDQGLITEEDYNKKKNQLLGL